jgi:hypothetical protein
MGEAHLQTLRSLLAEGNRGPHLVQRPWMDIRKDVLHGYKGWLDSREDPVLGLDYPRNRKSIDLPSFPSSRQ